MAKKKITRKKLLKEPDEFITFTSKMIRFSTKYKIQISVALGIIIILSAGFFAIEYFSNKADNNSLVMLQKCIDKYDALAKNNMPEKAYNDVKEDFNMILKKYSGKNGGKFARVIYADICFKAGEYDKAIELYDKALPDFKSNQFITGLLLSSLGYCNEAKKEDRVAIEYFEKVVSKPDNILNGDIYFNIGCLYDAMGKSDKSKEAFKKILTDYADSIYYRIAEEKLADNS